MTLVTSEREDYWTAFYSANPRANALQPPSQFAAFIAQELEPGTVIFDVGCGNGRDSLFFAALGFKVIAIDQSEPAIIATRARAIERDAGNLHAVIGDISGPYLGDALATLGQQRACVYARFFLHAISADEQNRLLDTLAARLQPGHLFAVEYRTTTDQFLKKHAPPHYRRYQSSRDLNAAVQSRGFRLTYAAEGQGFAKYKAEDAIVARAIFEKR